MSLLWGWIKWAIAALLMGVLSIYLLNQYVIISTKEKIYTDLKQVPAKKAAIVLGTNKYIAKGKLNYYYIYRIRAAAALWKAGKVKAILVSGDNATKQYNETKRMKDDLIKAGVPKAYIATDYAGFRTLDSLVRAKEVFGLENYIIISQKFHLERALFIANAKGYKAIGFAAKEIEGTPSAKKMMLREYFARVKAFLDLYLLHTEPKFYGKKVKVQYKS